MATRTQGAAPKEASMEEQANELTERDFEALLTEAIERFAEDSEEPVMEAGIEVTTFEAAGLLTDNRGLVIEIGDAEFQVSIIRRR
ncbi:MAG TPA: hypothetical protein DEF51_06105 [Myxococcales bacterium]|jgi:hypothetical protein|nr:hypothetical protein [Myxococcales bacterium]